jgi:hypothetical protein
VPVDESSKTAYFCAWLQDFGLRLGNSLKRSKCFIAELSAVMSVKLGGTELVNPGETGWLENYGVGVTSAGLLIHTGPGGDGGIGKWRTKRSGWAE